MHAVNVSIIALCRRLQIRESIKNFAARTFLEKQPEVLILLIATNAVPDVP